MNSTSQNYLSSVTKQCQLYKRLGEKTFAQLNDEQLFIELSEDSNSIAIIVKHIVGNMLSRFTNFLTEDGEKEWRNRDTEFESTYASREEMLQAWENGWTCLFEALGSVTNKNLEDLVYIRNEGHTIIEALNRQANHYAYHVGQIVILGKIHLGTEWKSLSIPKGKSVQFNNEKFNLARQKKHFTDDS